MSQSLPCLQLLLQSTLFLLTVPLQRQHTQTQKHVRQVNEAGTELQEHTLKGVAALFYFLNNYSGYQREL